LFIASDAVSNLDQLSLSQSQLYPEFDHWKRVRNLGFTIDFRRILKLGSDLAILPEYTIDISLFDRETNHESIEMYKRMEDGLLIVVKSIQNVEHLNLRHPCITAPIGFINSTSTARLYWECCSLAETIATKPSWWTSTAKAKAVAGIVLGLRFAHSFGFIHGRLTLNNILLDSDHGVQITDFFPVCNEEWTPKEDVSAFVSILREIVVDHIPHCLSSCTDTPNCSFSDILQVLKKENFNILKGVDSANVSKYVNWVELMEQSGDCHPIAISL
jgi:hypothetical protein